MYSKAVVLLLVLSNTQAQEDISDACTATALTAITIDSEVTVVTDFDLGNDLEEIGSSAVQLESGEEFSIQDTAVSTGGACPDELGDVINCLWVFYATQLSFGVGVLVVTESGGAVIQNQVELVDPTDSFYTGITFDFDGNLFAVNTAGDVALIDLDTGVVEEIAEPVEACDPEAVEGCAQSLFYDCDEEELLRVASPIVGGTSTICSVGPFEECQDITDEEGLCFGTEENPRFIVSVLYVGPLEALVSCSNEGGSEVATALLDLSNAEIVDPLGVDTDSEAMSFSFYNAFSDAYCGCDFAGTNEMETTSPGDDDDDSSSSSDSDDSDSDDDDDSDSDSESDDSGDGDDAKAFFAELDKTAQDLETETETANQGEETNISLAYNIRFSDELLTTIWIMAAICLLVNATAVFCAWRNGKRAQVTV